MRPSVIFFISVFASHGLKGFSLTSVSKVTGLGHKPIALRLWILKRYGLGKLQFNVIFLCCICR